MRLGRLATTMPMLALTYVSPSLNGTASATARRDAVGLGQHLGVAGRVEHEHRELVAAEAGDGVGGPDRPLEAPSDDPQQLVAGVVAEAVVDHLEAVEVEQHQRHPLTLVSDAAERPLQPVHELGPVGQPGELVVAGRVLEALGDRLALRDVLDLADDELRAVGLRDVGERQRGPHRAAVGPDVALLELVVASRLPAQLLGGELVEAPVVGVRELLDVAAEQLVGAVAEHPGEGAVHLDERAVHLGERHPDRGVLEGGAESLLGVGEGGVGLQLLRDLADADHHPAHRGLGEEVGRRRTRPRSCRRRGAGGGS